MRWGFITSVNTQSLRYSVPSGPCIVLFQTPPGRTSISSTVSVKPYGPHHFTICSGSVHASQTSSRGASKTRVITTSRSAPNVGAASGPLVLPAATRRLLSLQGSQVFIQTIEAFEPETPIALDPVSNLFQRRRAQSAGAPLRVSLSYDEPRALQHLQVFRDSRHAHVERLRKLGHRDLSGGQTRQNGAPRWIGKRSESRAQRFFHLAL